MSVRYLVGDVFDRMAELEDGSIDLILTSPPFLALRSYLPADHPDKDKEIGSESTPAEFVDVLLRLTAEWRRLLTPHGSLCVELGDTFSGSGGAGGDYGANGWREGQQKFRQNNLYTSGYSGGQTGLDVKTIEGEIPYNGGPGWPLAKSLALVPEAYRFALAYGHNPHTGVESPAGQWRIRNVIRWVRPNPPVGALGDKFRPATSELVVACVSDKRFFDLDAVREPYKFPDHPQIGKNHMGKKNAEKDGNWGTFPTRKEHPAGAPPLDWWKISPTGYAGAHYAVWPPELCVKPIKAMCPEKVCRECGEPSRRVVGQAEYVKPTGAAHSFHGDGFVDDTGTGANRRRVTGFDNGNMTRVAPTLGFTDCGHDDWRPGTVLDPFAGTGTTLAVAHGHGRNAIGIDIDERNAALARDRVGPLFLEVIA